jgi:NAD(P)-dependent dehydrogenase (short-subunit alcohol dehydrogenase family)
LVAGPGIPAWKLLLSGHECQSEEDAMVDLRDKVVLVTGAATGIGRAMALECAGGGAAVVVSDLDAERGGQTAAAIREQGGQARFIAADVADIDQVESLVAQIKADEGRLDGAINNAGIEGQQAPTAECTAENWTKVIGVNLTGAFLSTRAELGLMLEQGSGSIVNVSSVAGKVGFMNLPAYVASKHGMLGLTRTAALEVAEQGVRVNAICPGVIRTEMIDRITGGDPEAEKQFTALEPVGRMGRPEEVARAAAWLVSDAASFVTGTALDVDGAFLAR